jgi:poly-gamma-glutamate capsule biosynthesis protein CapA/YwtB (metallophosphatase superfamily)
MGKRYCLLALGVLLVLAGTGPAWAEKTTLVFTGDTAFGESYRIRPEQQAALLGDNRYLPSMKALVPLLGGAREVLVNLETPLALPNDSAPTGKDYIHWADPEKAVAALKAAGVTAVGLANNHTMDQGAKGLDETLAVLGKAGISTWGAGRHLEAAEKPLLWSVPLGKGTTPVAVFFGFEYRRNYDEQFDFYAGANTPGVLTLDPERLKTQIRSLRAKIPGLTVIAFPHWGKNYAWKTEEQTRSARELVDAGADLVIGHGAHQLQEIELYKGKWVLYGLGNFVFHSPGRYSSRGAPPYGLVARLDLEETAGTPKKTLRLYPIQCDNTVTGFRTRPVNPQEFTEMQALLLRRTDGKSVSGIRAKKDELGFHLEIALP